MSNIKAKKVDKESALACAFVFMDKSFLTNDEIASYLDILKSFLPDDCILYGVNDPARFIADRYGVITPSPDGYFITGDLQDFNYYFLFRMPSNIIEICKSVCEILKSIEEVTDEVSSSENFSLKKTI